MKQQILSLLTIVLLSSCISTKRFTAIVAPKFSTIKTDNNTNNFIFNFSALDTASQPVVSTKLKNQFIPAILFWQWNKTIKCEIAPKIVAQSFQENFLRFADTFNLQEKLEGRKLEIRLEKIPNSFVYFHKGNTIIFLIAYVISDMETIFPQEQNLEISYKLTKAGKTIKEGKLMASNKDVTVKNIWKSTKKFTWLYIDQFKLNNKTMTKEIVEKLQTEI